MKTAKKAKLSGDLDSDDDFDFSSDDGSLFGDSKCLDRDSNEDDCNELIKSNLDDDDDGSDSSPEEINFATGKQKSQLIRKQAVDQKKALQDSIKRKRSFIHNRNLMQKMRKKLSGQRLPEELLEDIDSQKSGAVDTVKTVKIAFPFIKDEMQEDKDSSIIYGPTIFKVRNLEKEIARQSTMCEDAASFKNRVIYGRKNRREASSHSFFIKKEKQKFIA